MKILGKFSFKFFVDYNVKVMYVSPFSDVFKSFV